MAGTIFGLGLSQRTNPNGLPDSGWKLYLYSAASDTPVTAYKDTGLTAGLEHPWPIQADAYGTMPAFWLADGSYRARGVSNDGSRLYFDLASVLALGASSGSGGGGSSVDPNAIFQTGDVIWVDVAGTRTGWVRDNGRTIGSATSGATERANSDTQALFEWLWNNFSDSVCAVPGGRGASAAADWAANKQITLPDKRGYIAGGLDDMGNSAAGRYANVPVVSGSTTAAGSVLGETLHQLVTGELANHGHTLHDPGHVHNSGQSLWTQVGGQAQGHGPGTDMGIGQIESATTGITIDNAGSDIAHNNVQKTVLGTFYRKL